MVEFNGKELRLTTKKIMMLERKLGKNPIDVFIDADNGKMPKVSDIINILGCAMDGISESGVIKHYEEWIEDGHYMTDILPILVDLYAEAGLLGSGADSDPN